MKVRDRIWWVALLCVAAAVILGISFFDTRRVFDSFGEALGDLGETQLVFACSKVEMTDYVNVSGDSIPSVRLEGVTAVALLKDFTEDQSNLVIIRNRTMSSLVRASYLRLQKDPSLESEWTMGVLPLSVVWVSKLKTSEWARESLNPRPLNVWINVERPLSGGNN